MAFGVALLVLATIGLATLLQLLLEQATCLWRPIPSMALLPEAARVEPDNTGQEWIPCASRQGDGRRVAPPRVFTSSEFRALMGTESGRAALRRHVALYGGLSVRIRALDEMVGLPTSEMIDAWVDEDRAAVDGRQ